MRLCIVFFFLIVTSGVCAQSPQSIPYQAILRNADGSIVFNASASLTFKIHEVEANGAVVYEENHTVNTNSQGLVSLSIGTGSVVSGTFGSIQWGTGDKFLQVLMNAGSGNVDFGTQQMMSVPYALYSEDVDMRVSLIGDSLIIGNQVSIIPGVSAANLPANVVLDVDGNGYTKVTIGNQVWLKENLKTSHYANGEAIQTGLTDLAWGSTTSGAWSYYNDLATNNTFGKLYNWYAVTDLRGVCPTGWHVPTDAEWTEMISWVDPTTSTTCGPCFQSTLAGGPLKSMNQWSAPNTGATDAFDLSLLGVGDRAGSNGYLNFGNQGYYWTSTAFNAQNAWYRRFSYNNTNVGRLNDVKQDGFSVRCIQN
jgi:uncharacterized protein (TIGR02145 family)